MKFEHHHSRLSPQPVAAAEPLGGIEHFMKSKLIDLAHKWWIGVCLLLWSWLTYAALGVPVMLIIFLPPIGGSFNLEMTLLGIYIFVCAPLIVYRIGREFVQHHDKICPEKKSERDHAA